MSAYRLDFITGQLQAGPVLHWLAEEAFDDLLTWWREHHRRRLLVDENRIPDGAVPSAEQSRHWDQTVAALAASRTQLDNARDRMHQFRSALHPESAIDSPPLRVHLCETLDALVHLGWQHLDPIRPGNLVCPCGTLVPLHPL